MADAQLDVDGSRGCLGSLAAIKQRTPHLKVILSIGGAESSQNFAAVAASAALRDNFGRSARGLVAASDLDGIDSKSTIRLYLHTCEAVCYRTIESKADMCIIVDWEHPCDAQQGRDFLSLLATVRLHLPNDEYLLTAALPAGYWVLQHIDLYRAQEYLDFINLMAYDFYGPWTPTAGHHAQLYPGNTGELSGSVAVDYVKSTGFPAKKILLGIPAYGRSFLGANGPGETCRGYGGEEGSFEYRDLPRPGTEERVDNARVAASCVGGDGGFVSYDNPQTVTVKGRYCKAEQLGVSRYLFNFEAVNLTVNRVFSTGRVQQMHHLMCHKDRSAEV